MKRTDWLRDCELADPDTTVVSHIVGCRRHWLGLILPGTVRALCGDDLASDDDSADPTPDSPVCTRCALRAWTPNRLLTACLRFGNRHPAPVLLTLLAVLCASIAGLLVAVWLHTQLAWIPVGFLDASIVLLHFAPDGCDENGSDQ